MSKMTKSMTGDAPGEVSVCAGGAAGSKVAADAALNGVESKAIQPKDYARKERDKWLNRLAKEFLILGSLTPFENILPEEFCPDWVRRVEDEYFVAMYRGIDPKTTSKFTPVGMGGFIGYQCAYAVWMMECLSARLEEGMKDQGKSKDLVPTKEEVVRGLDILRRFNQWYIALRRFAGRALKSCVYQSYEDMSGFLIGYSNAFRKKPSVGASLGDFGSTNFGIYHFMIWHWRVVEQLGSVRALHEMLRRSMGEHRVGELKRVEKICQRIGLHFRKPGRPKKSQ